MDLNKRIRELEVEKGKDPRATIQRACSAIEVFLREMLNLPNGTSLAVLQGEFRNQHPNEIHLHHKITTLRKMRNAIVHENRQPWPGEDEIAIGTVKNFAYFVQQQGLMLAGPEPSLPLPALFRDAYKLRVKEPLPSRVMRFLHIESEAEREPRLDWKQFEKLVESHFEDVLGKEFDSQVPQQLSDGSKRVFDFVSRDGEIVIECKSHTWTKGGNYPSAKVSNALVAVESLKRHPADRRLLVFQDDMLEGVSLAETFLRRNLQRLAGIEVWRYFNGLFEQVSPKR